MIWPNWESFSFVYFASSDVSGSVCSWTYLLLFFWRFRAFVELFSNAVFINESTIFPLPTFFTVMGTKVLPSGSCLVGMLILSLLLRNTGLRTFHLPPFAAEEIQTERQALERKPPRNHFKNLYPSSVRKPPRFLGRKLSTISHLE